MPGLRRSQSNVDSRTSTPRVSAAPAPVMITAKADEAKPPSRPAKNRARSMTTFLPISSFKPPKFFTEFAQSSQAWQVNTETSASASSSVPSRYEAEFIKGQVSVAMDLNDNDLNPDVPRLDMEEESSLVLGSVTEAYAMTSTRVKEGGDSPTSCRTSTSFHSAGWDHTRAWTSRWSLDSTSDSEQSSSQDFFAHSDTSRSPSPEPAESAVLEIAASQSVVGLGKVKKLDLKLEAPDPVKVDWHPSP